MSLRPAAQRILSSGPRNQTAVVLALLAAACVIGFSVVSLGSGLDPALIGISVLGLTAIAGGTLLVLDVSLIALVRFAFIASFFLKADFMLFKVNELEDPSGLNISLALAAGLCLLAYDHYSEADARPVLPRYAIFLFIALFGCAAASFVYAGMSPLGGFSILSLATSILIAYVMASHFSRPERLKDLVIMIGGGLAFTGAVALSQYAFQWPVNLSFLGTGTEEEQLGTQSIELARVPAFLRTPNGMALVVSSLLPIVLAPVIFRVKSITSRESFVLLAGSLAGIVGVILSLARGSWIALAVTIALILFCGWFRLPANGRRTYLASSAAILVLAAAVTLPFADRIYDRITEDDQGAAAVRIPLMQTASEMIEANPLLGVGLNSYRANMTRYDETSSFVSQDFYAPVHNIFAHVAAEIGIPGGILFCLLLILALVECVKTASHRDAFVAAVAIGTAIGLVAFTISALKEPGSLGSVRPPMRTLFLLLGIAFALGRIRRGTAKLCIS